MRRSATAVLVLLGVLVVLLLSSLFVVDERQKALVLQFGQIRQVREEPGLGFKVPFIQEVVYYEDRILSLDTEEIEVTPSDDRRLVVDAFARYRIGDVVRFRQAVGAGGEAVAEDRLASILNATIREVLGAEGVTSDTILSTERRSLMTRIRDLAQADAESLGLSVVDVRLKMTNLPQQNLAATFDRMRAERQREAADERARGAEAAQGVRAQADRTVSETISAAERDADITRGEADAEANRIFAEAYGADPDFFRFYRSMQAYDLALRGNNSTMVLTPENEFFDYLYGSGGTEGATPAAAPAAAATATPGAVESGTVESGPVEPEAAAPDAGDAEVVAPEPESAAEQPAPEDATAPADEAAADPVEAAPAP